MTSHIQPLDAGIIRAFKAWYRKLYISIVLEQDDNGAKDIYKIDQLRGMRLALEAWSHITSTTVSNCWRHAGILGGPANIVDADVQAVELELKEALEKIVASENVTRRNITSINDLLDIEGEKQTESEWTVEELVEQQQFDKREENGEHIEDLDGDPEPEPEPDMTWAHASAAISALERLLHTHTGATPDEARIFLPKLQRFVRKEINSSLTQRNLLSYFGAP